MISLNDSGIRAKLAWKLTEYESKDIDEALLSSILDEISEGKGQELKRSILQDQAEWHYERILERSWNIIRDVPLSYFDSESADSVTYAGNLTHGPGLWIEAQTLLAIWKLPIEIHRPGGRHPVVQPDGKLAFWDSIGCGEDERTRVCNALRAGRAWLDRSAQELNWELKSPYTEGVSTQELSMYVFVRSHLAWHKGALESPVPVEAVYKLLESGDEQGWWADVAIDGSRRGAIASDCEPSIRATAMAVAGLMDWVTSVRYVLDSSNTQWSCESGVEQTLQLEDVGQLLKRASERCSRALSFLDTNKVQGGWPGRQSGYMPDVRATSHSVYVFDRFSSSLDYPRPTDAIKDAADWLLDFVSEMLPRRARRSPEMVQDMALAVTVLAANEGIVDSALWLRRVLQWLLDDERCPEQSGARAQRSLDATNAWRLYAAVEMIRRKSIKDRVGRLV